MKLLLLLSFFMIITLSVGIADAYHNSLLDRDCDDVQDRITHVTCNDVQYLHSIILEYQDQLDVLNSTINDMYSSYSIISVQQDIFNETLSNVEYLSSIISAQQDTINATLNDSTIRINELTLLHYPTSEENPLTPPVPEIVPLPEYPISGETPELAPNTPEIEKVIARSGSIGVEFDITVNDIDDRYEEYQTAVLELSIDGINWYFSDKRQLTSSDDVIYLQGYSLENYVEYLTRTYAYNESANSTNSLIWSGIPTAFLENTEVSISDITNTYIEIEWEHVDTFSHIPLYWIIERSVNYEEFKVVEDTYQYELDSNNYYTDYDVISGNIYSYRVTMVTDFETQTRSGFASVLIP